MRKYRFSTIVIAVVLTVVCLEWYHGVLEGPYLLGNNDGARDEAKKLNIIKRILDESYYKELDDKKLIEGAIDGMVYSIGDVYTSYYPKEYWESTKENLEGEYEGIGVLVATLENKGAVIEEVTPNTPADKAKLKAGDLFVEINGENVRGMKHADVVERIKGSEAKELNIKVYRESVDQIISVDIKKEKITKMSVSSKVIDKILGYIKIENFDNNVFSEFKDQYDKLKNVKKIKGLIIDVRDNPGGSLYEVLQICDVFLKDVDIVYLQDREGNKEYKKADDKADDIPLVILANGNSASASEVLSAAIKENNRGIVIGEKTFGKALVQTYTEFKDGSCLYYTMASYYTPKGNNIHGKGVEPSIEVKQKGKKDTPLLRAIKELRGK